MKKLKFSQVIANIFNFRLFGVLSLLVACVFIVIECVIWLSIQNYVERDLAKLRGLFYLCCMNCIYTSCFCLLINWIGIVYKLMAKKVLQRLFQVFRVGLILLNAVVVLFFVVSCILIYSLESITNELLVTFYSIFEAVIIMANICFGLGNVAFGVLMYKAIQYSSSYVQMRRGIQHYSFVKFQIAFGFTLLVHTCTLCFILLQNVVSWDVFGVSIYLLTIPFSLLISIFEVLLLVFAYVKGAHVQHLCCWICVLVDYSKRQHKYGRRSFKSSTAEPVGTVYSAYSSTRSSVSNFHQEHQELIQTLEDFAQDSEEDEFIPQVKEYDIQDHSVFTDIVLDISSSSKSQSQSKSNSTRESLLS